MINECKPIILSELYDTLHSEDFRKKCYENGVEKGKNFIENYKEQGYKTETYKDISTNLLNDS
mgnify:FL=1